MDTSSNPTPTLFWHDKSIDQCWKKAEFATLPVNQIGPAHPDVIDLAELSIAAFQFSEVEKAPVHWIQLQPLVEPIWLLPRKKGKCDVNYVVAGFRSVALLTRRFAGVSPSPSIPVVLLAGRYKPEALRQLATHSIVSQRLLSDLGDTAVAHLGRCLRKLAPTLFPGTRGRPKTRTPATTPEAAWLTEGLPSALALARLLGITPDRLR